MIRTENGDVILTIRGGRYLLVPLNIKRRRGDRKDMIDFALFSPEGPPLTISLGFIPTLRTLKGERLDRRLRRDLRNGLMEYFDDFGHESRNSEDQEMLDIVDPTQQPGTE